MTAERDRALSEASQLFRAGRPEALASYETLLARWPELAESWFNLAILRRKAGRFEDALNAYAEALERGASGPEEIHLNRAVILSDDLRRPEAAEAELRTALKLKPRYGPALLNLGNLLEDLGDRPGARGAYETLLAAEPGHASALARLANLSPPDDGLIARLDQAQARAAPAEKAELLFALGRLLDAAGRYGEAFDRYAAANAASRRSGQARYDRAFQEGIVDRLIAAFPEAGGGASHSQPPIFIVGMFRSGSTLVEQVLASHPRVTMGGELGLLPSLIRERLRPYPESVAAADPAPLAQAYRDGLTRRFPDADLVTDKRPDNLFHVGLIKRLFPDARIVNTVREPLDNILSAWFLHLDHSMAYALDLEDTAHQLIQQRRLMAHWKQLWPDDILDFDYDAFVAEPRPQLERLLAFLGLGWTDAVLDFHKAETAVKTASVWQVRQPLYQASSGRWRNYEAQLAGVRAYLGSTPERS